MAPNIVQLLNPSFHILFFVLTLVFIVFTVCVVYHWFTYGSSRSTSMISLCAYLVVSAPLFMIMSLTLTMM